MAVKFVNKLKVKYDIEFNRLCLTIFIPKRVGQKVLATFDGEAWRVSNTDTVAYVNVCVSTKSYYSLWECLIDVVNNRLSYKYVIDLESRRASYELLRALRQC